MRHYAYYNEFDPNAAAWLRELIKSKQIMDGEVDERSIHNVTQQDLKGFTRVGFFAGIGGWDLALQLAGWPEDRPVWHGSCPCQPFSVAGNGLGDTDERHLWPVFFNLIRECRPVTVFGEQVANAVGKGWLDGVSSDLERAGYACGATVLGAHSVGAPHIRQRLFWVADSAGGQREQCLRPQGYDLQRPAYDGPAGGLAHSGDAGPQGRLPQRADAGRQDQHGRAGCGGPAGWSHFDVRPCADGKSRRIESGLSPVVNGVPRGVVPSSDLLLTAEARVMRLRGFGNAIVPQVAAEFILAHNETTNNEANA